MINNYINKNRRKAWLGAAIGAVVGVGSSIFGAVKQKEAQAQQYALQRNAELRNTGLTSAVNLTRAYANTNELDKEFRDRFLRYGGRRKAEDGGGFKWSSSDTDALISGLGSAGSSLATSFIGQASQRANYINAINPATIDKKDNNVVYDSAARNEMLNNYYRTAMLRAGGCRRR